MLNLDKKEINFIGYRKVFLTISAILVIASVLVIGLKGLNFGIEFVGGSTITFLNGTTASQVIEESEISATENSENTSAVENAADVVAENLTNDVAAEESIGTEAVEEAANQPLEDLKEADVRAALTNAGYDGEIIVQTLNSGSSSGFLCQISTTDVQEASQYASKAAEELGVSSENVEVSTIGPNWGSDVIKNMLVAFLASIICIIIYIAIRFEYKMGITAVVALLHDIIIVIGVYALVGREVTPNAVAALLTIMGYSLYDTVVVFHRINDNVTSGKVKHSFWTIANHSINQVLTRTINTTLTSLVPVLAMLFFGGVTLQDFAFAMSIGLICGSYSSIAVASPLYAIWKQHEPQISQLNKRYGTTVITDTERVLAGIDVKSI